MATTATQTGCTKCNCNCANCSPQKAGAALQDQAATAALYVTKNQRNTDSNRFLDADQKLSSASAATSLKYADPRDLPSYPSAGLKQDNSAAGTAATLGWGKPGAPEYWKPDGVSSAASKAALLANGYKAPPLWQAEKSSDGAKAALLAARDGKGVKIWKPEVSNWGNSAANQAMKTERDGTLNQNVEIGSDHGRQRSMMAANGAMSGSRKRAGSTPVVAGERYPDEANAVANALRAANHANHPARKSPTDVTAQGGSSPFTNMPASMFTANPPVQPEVDEKRRSDTLHASAVAMAKQMFAVQQKSIDAANKDLQRSESHYAANSAHGRKPSSNSIEDESTPMKFNYLQEAAQRLAQERLAKLHDEHAQNREYREYYGNEAPSRSRMSLRSRPRRRASSDGILGEDKEQSQKIRAQMSLFSSNLSQVDSKKKQADRDALMAAAQRNVTARLSGMDERVFKDTGKVAPSLLSDWELKAHAAAQKNSESRMENYGKVNIGGGKFINQSAIDLVARRNVQPVLDEITEKAQLQRAKDAEIILEREAAVREAETKKQREREVKDINKKLAQQDKAEKAEARAEEKAEQKRIAEQEKAAKAEQRRSMKSEKRKSTPAAAVSEPVETPVATKDETAVESPAVVDTENTPEISPVEKEKAVEAPVTTKEDAGYQAPAGLRTSMELHQQDRLEQVIKEGQEGENKPSERKPGWFKRLSLRTKTEAKEKDAKDTSNGKKPFLGGKALAGGGAAAIGTESATATALSHNHDESSAPPGDGGADSSQDDRGRAAVRPISPISSVSSLNVPGAGAESDASEVFAEARDNFDEALAPAPTFPAQKSSSPNRTSKFVEEV